MIRNVLDTENFGLKLEPAGDAKEPWEVICFSDSDYTGNPISIRCISGFILYVFVMPSLGNQKL